MAHAPIRPTQKLPRQWRKTMDPKKPLPDPAPARDPMEQRPIPDIDVNDRANQAFLDSLIDTDGRPMRDAIDMPEEEEIDDEDAEDDLDRDL
jgi:hypothetical protein